MDTTIVDELPRPEPIGASQHVVILQLKFLLLLNNFIIFLYTSTCNFNSFGTSYFSFCLKLLIFISFE